MKISSLTVRDLVLQDINSLKELFGSLGVDISTEELQGAREDVGAQFEANRKRKKEATLRWLRSNPGKTYEYSKRWKSKNPDKVKLYSRRQYLRVKNFEEYKKAKREGKRRYYDKHKEIIALRSKEKWAAMTEEEKESVRNLRNEYARKYYHRRMAAMTEEERERVLQRRREVSRMRYQRLKEERERKWGAVDGVSEAR